jgi:5-methylcytosine-specific restriction endonuclease McrA
MSNHNIHGTYRWRQLAKQVKPGAVCWLCGGVIQFGLRRNHPLGPSLDHIIPVSVRPDLAHEPANLRPAHYGCNARKKDGQIKPRRTPDDW